jgi:hypothetical protein
MRRGGLLLEHHCGQRLREQEAAGHVLLVRGGQFIFNSEAPAESIIKTAANVKKWM